jgi:uncharacterized membrane protein HdeD (DUF308 family)
MTTATATTGPAARGSVPQWLVIVLGVCYIVLGLFLMFQPALSLVTIAIFTGASWFISGVMDLISLFRDRERWFWTLLSGVIGIWAGLVLLGSPLAGTLVLATFWIFVVALSGIMLGVVRIVQSFKGAGWGVGIWGAITLFLSGWLLFNPLTGVAVTPFVFGGFAIAGGILTLIAAFTRR